MNSERQPDRHPLGHMSHQGIGMRRRVVLCSPSCYSRRRCCLASVRPERGLGAISEAELGAAGARVASLRRRQMSRADRSAADIRAAVQIARPAGAHLPHAHGLRGGAARSCPTSSAVPCSRPPRTARWQIVEQPHRLRLVRAATLTTSSGRNTSGSSASRFTNVRGDFRENRGEWAFQPACRRRRRPSSPTACTSCRGFMCRAG